MKISSALRPAIQFDQLLAFQCGQCAEEAFLTRELPSSGDLGSFRNSAFSCQNCGYYCSLVHWLCKTRCLDQQRVLLAHCQRWATTFDLNQMEISWTCLVFHWTLRHFMWSSVMHPHFKERLGYWYLLKGWHWRFEAKPMLNSDHGGCCLGRLIGFVAADMIELIPLWLGHFRPAKGCRGLITCVTMRQLFMALYCHWLSWVEVEAALMIWVQVSFFRWLMEARLGWSSACKGSSRYTLDTVRCLPDCLWWTNFQFVDCP